MAEVPACLTLPPAEAEYTPKGSYETIGDLKCYIVGPKDAASAIVYVYDIFGYTPQSLQGADLLASQGTLVVQPDFFKGEGVPKEWFGSTDPTIQAKRAAFSAGPGAPANSVGPLTAVVDELKSKYGVKKVGATGFCWGAKVCILNKAIDAIGLVHPSRLTPEDGEAVTVPTCLLPSSGEDAELMASVWKALQAKPFADKCVHKTFSESVHGWAAARCDLTDPVQKEKYEEAYAILSQFFTTVLA